jgi:hypothetical protein
MAEIGLIPMLASPRSPIFWGGRNMQNYIINENIRCYRKLIAMSTDDPHRDEARHRTLVQLLAEEEAKHVKPDDWPNE